MGTGHSSGSGNGDHSRAASRFRSQALIFWEILLRVLILSPFAAPQGGGLAASHS
jgi:hypothetical protein